MRQTSSHVEMVFAFPRAGFVMMQMTAMTGLMNLIAVS